MSLSPAKERKKEESSFLAKLNGFEIIEKERAILTDGLSKKAENIMDDMIKEVARGHKK